MADKMIQIMTHPELVAYIRAQGLSRLSTAALKANRRQELIEIALKGKK